MKQKRFTKEFEEEAVRVLRTSGRTKREIGEDLGVSLSTLTRWVSRSRDREMDQPDRRPLGEDAAAELKRLRRENETLRQERDILKRANGSFRQGGKSVRFELVDRAKRDFLVHRLCRVLGVSQSGYFAWRTRLPSQRQRQDMVLFAHVRSAFALSNGTYGSPRMTRELQDQGLAVGRRRTARIMRDNGMRARQKRCFKRTTDSEHAWPVAPNLLDPDLTATAVNQKWSADISYVSTREGWLYLAIVMDLLIRFAAQPRRIIGWSVSDRLHRNLALAALRQAVAIRRPDPGLICHSDRGSQYCSMDYQRELQKHGALISMSGKGNCFDNAIVGTFFKPCNRNSSGGKPS